MMERRWNMRSPIRLDVALVYDGLGIVRCRTRDLSLAGLFLETGAITLPHHAAFDVMLDDGAAPRKMFRLPALVVRVTREGVGAMFRDLDNRAADHLKTLLIDYREADATA